MRKNEDYKILLVDDDVRILKALRRLLYLKGYSVLLAESGAQALDVLSRDSVHIVISDMKMPGMSGAEFLVQVAKYWPEIIRICLTGQANIEDTIQAVNQAGIFHYINKPWEEAELVRVIEAACGAYSENEKEDIQQVEISIKNKDLSEQNVQLSRQVASTSEQLEEASDKLALANKEKEILHVAKREAESLSLAKSRFLASMSHEMRSPLNAIISMNALLLQSNLSEEQHRLAKLAHDGGQTLLSLINDVLDFSKIESGKLELNYKWFDQLSVVENICDLMYGQVTDKPVEIAIVVSPGTPRFLFGDEVRFRQILFNIIGNAIKFTEQGGVVITLSAGETGLNLQVKDTGIGISQEQQSKVFEDFYQVDNANTRMHGGTGLGLAICSKLVGLMDGKISLTSEEGEGSCFDIYLPLDTKDPVVVTEVPKPLTAVFDTSNRILYKAIHEQLSYFNCTVVSPSEFSAQHSEDNDSVLLMDSNNSEILKERLQDSLRQVKDHEARQNFLSQNDLVMLVNSDSANIDDQALIRDLGNPKKITKPVKLIELLDSMGITKADSVEKMSDLSPTEKSAEKSASSVNDKSSLPIPKEGSPIEILLVEDSEVNQEIVKTILSDENCHIDLANNGSEGVQKASQKKYAMILMDMAMPVMNGLDAAAAIRANEGPNRETIIIAMTANAFAEDRQQCLNAGMDDYLTKPIDIDAFFSCLSKWLDEESLYQEKTPERNGLRENVKDIQSLDEKNIEEITAEKMPVPGAGSDLADQEIINLETVNRLFKDASPKVLPKIFGIYFNETENRIAKMQIAFAEEDWTLLQDEAHALKSSSGSFGAQVLFDLAREIETDLRQGITTNLSGHMCNIEDIATNSIVQLKAILDQMLG